MTADDAPMTASEIIAALPFGEPYERRPGDVPEAAILIVKWANVHDGDPAVARVASEGLSYWECLGILADAYEDVKAEGRSWE